MSSSEKSYILVVDDLPDNIFLLQTILESEGYTVDAALDGGSALGKIQAAPPNARATGCHDARYERL